MESSLCTFIDILSKEIDCGGGKKIIPTKIIIPIIQRDYAQGRDSAEIKRIRSRFLGALYKAVTENPVTLDFIYGDIDDEGILTPLDGQQRLTTLFLLHWYAAKKDNVPADKTAFLKNFSYEIRPDARDFCKCLVEFSPSFDEKNLSAEIENQSWFPLNWRKDPTVNAMLRMLDAIHEKFFNVQNLWSELESGAIYFHFLSIKNIGLTDELYITMNSRGKPLTDFEHFKAEFKSRLDKFDENISRRIILKIDTKWTDLLWKFRGNDNLIDDMFLNYFRFLCDILRYKRGGTSQGKSTDEFDLLEEFFNEGNVIDNINFLEKSFDCWCAVDDINKFFDERVSLGDRTKRGVNHHQRGKIIIYFDEKNIFKNCLKSYKRTPDGKRKFSLPKTILLYAFQKYLLERDKISDEDFRRRLRVINNLVNNSLNAEMSDSEERNNGNRFAVMLNQADDILLSGKFPYSSESGFNSNQLQEEREKFIWTAQNPDSAESLFELEDHYLLYGQIAILGLENHNYFRRFISLFNCDYDKIDCALITLGDYFQYTIQNSRKRYQFGNKKHKSWQSLFHKSSVNKNFEGTKDCLLRLLELTKNKSLDKIISDFLSDCERRKSFEWNYYYIKYPVFRPDRYGKYDWENFDAAPYKFIALWAEKQWSENACQPFLKALEPIFNSCEYDAREERLIVGESYYIVCENSAYVIFDIATDEKSARLDIRQINGVDVENRIEKFRHWEGKNFLL